MIVWRLCNARYASSALSGEGALIAGGRWNPRGVRVAYCSSSLALAVLEALVHLSATTIPNSYSAVQVELPDDIDVATAVVPKDWRSMPTPSSTRDAGLQWVNSGTSALLAVPSVVVPLEMNYLLNPAHADAARVKIVNSTPFEFDSRLLARDSS